MAFHIDPSFLPDVGLDISLDDRRELKPTGRETSRNWRHYSVMSDVADKRSCRPSGRAAGRLGWVRRGGPADRPDIDRANHDKWTGSIWPTSSEPILGRSKRT